MKSPLKAKANKNLGQHFLTDQNIIEKITQDHADTKSQIIEVGPGPGALTQKLSQIDSDLFLIEKDIRFEKSLQQFCNQDHIHFADALDFDLASLSPNETKSQALQTWMVSNLPYNISSLLFIKFLQVPHIKYMTLMYQKEVGIKTANTDQKKSSLNCLSYNYFDSHVLCKVPPGAFSPPPRVNSIVISYTRKENPFIKLSDFPKYQKFLRKLFEHKRKKMLPMLKKSYGATNWCSILEAHHIDSNIRAEDLSHKEIQSLFQEMNLETNPGVSHG